jgi:hypothetical protein
VIVEGVTERNAAGTVMLIDVTAVLLIVIPPAELTILIPDPAVSAAKV